MSVPRPPSQGEELMAMHLTAYKIPFVREYEFADRRRFRFDFAIGQHIAVEVEGGVWSKGRHSRGSGFTTDCIKYNLAALQGWYVYRFTTDMVKSGEAIDTIRKALELEAECSTSK